MCHLCQGKGTPAATHATHDVAHTLHTVCTSIVYVYVLQMYVPAGLAGLIDEPKNPLAVMITCSQVEPWLG